jgi:two-component system NtrC family response regulator
MPLPRQSVSANKGKENMDTVYSPSQSALDSRLDEVHRYKRTSQSNMTATRHNNGAMSKMHTPDTVEVGNVSAPMQKTAQQHKLLVIDSNPESWNRHSLSFDDFELMLATDADTALAHVSTHQPAVVILDPGPGPHDTDAAIGLDLLESILNLAPSTKVIVITANGDRANAARAIGLGAYDYHQQPVDRVSLESLIKHAFDRHALEQESRNLLIRVNKDKDPDGISTCCAEMKHACRLVEKVAPTSATALLLGESGTGKELLAQALHRLSPRKNAPFIAINCAAIPANLLESELFGHEKGAFTGATARMIGKIERADTGTLFLDEIGDLSLPLQAKLLRFFQERVVQRVGGHSDIHVDLRIVCATHHNLAELIDKQLFREDLYYRISEIRVNIPALRDRPGDPPLLAREFLREASRRHGKSFRGFSNQALKAIDSYDWPGNARELKNCINRAVIMADGDRIDVSDLALPVEQHATPLMSLRQTRNSAEREILNRALSMTDGNISRVAEVLDTSRTTVYELITKHGIITPAKAP